MGITRPKSATDKPRPEETSEEDSGEIFEPGSDTAAAVDEPDSASKTAAACAERSAFRAGLIAAAAALAACVGLVLFGVLHTADSGATAEPRIAAAPVTYEVTGKGTADITYQARNTSGEAIVVKAATLPWHTTVDVPLGQDPTVSIVLTEQGGQASCALAIRGRHMQSATATGAFGRATCTGALPGPTPSEG
jgi:hypothetical protein